jgi:hypothetical protein
MLIGDSLHVIFFCMPYVQFMIGIFSSVNDVVSCCNIVIILCYIVMQVTLYTECFYEVRKEHATQIACRPYVPVLIQKPGRNI